MNARPLWQWRAMARQDLQAVWAIEASAYSHPWSPAQLAASQEGSHDCRVALAQGQPEVLGYAITLHSTGICHLLNITVRRDQQRQGLGRWMLQQVVDAAQASGAEAVWLEVRQSNHAAVSLYESAGFAHVGCRRGYYPALRGREDALLMTLALTAQPPIPPAPSLPV